MLVRLLLPAVMKRALTRLRRNHPFEVARIEAQARAAAGQPALSMPGVMKLVVAESGFTGLFTGLVPRVCLGIWQTLFMVTGAKLVKDILDVK